MLIQNSSGIVADEDLIGNIDVNDQTQRCNEHFFLGDENNSDMLDDNDKDDGDSSDKERVIDVFAVGFKMDCTAIICFAVALQHIVLRWIDLQCCCGE